MQNILQIEGVLQSLFYGQGSFMHRRSSVKINGFKISDQVDMLMSTMTPYRLLSEYNELKKLILFNSYFYPMEIYQLEDYIQR